MILCKTFPLLLQQENQPIFLLWVIVSSCPVSLTTSVSPFSSFMSHLSTFRNSNGFYRLLIINTPRNVRSLIKTRASSIKNIFKKKKKLKRLWDGRFKALRARDKGRIYVPRFLKINFRPGDFLTPLTPSQQSQPWVVIWKWKGVRYNLSVDSVTRLP